MKNEARKPNLLGFLPVVYILVLCSCQTVKVSTAQTDALFTDVQKNQTEIVDTGKQISDTTKVITETVADISKAGTITPTQIKTLVVYTQDNSAQVKTLNEKLAEQTVVIDQTGKSRLSDNASFSTVIAQKTSELKGEKLKASTRLVWALIATGIALVLAGMRWLPKLLKIIF